MISKLLEKFWNWYERNYLLNVGIAAILFSLQVFHLYWLATDVIAFKIFGQSFFNPTPILKLIIALVDYTEIPALITTSLVYLNDLRKQFKFKETLYLSFLLIQFLHIFWITDEVIVQQFTGTSPVSFPAWLAWVAILIDYLELPVIFETIKKFLVNLFKKLK